jgi:hypothetical protein
MVKMPEDKSTTKAAVLKLYEDRETSKKPRGHLGASQIGRECEREIWYNWRWVKPKDFEGRLLRLFETGHLEEERIKKNLRAIGVEVFDAQPGTSLQFAFKDGHFEGSVDGVLLGIPEAPKTPHLLEAKTSNDRRFKDLQKKGVREAQPGHYAQMQVYMGYLKLTRALYWCTNKNTDDIHIERINYDASAFQWFKDRANRIIASEEPPARIAEKATAFACKWCDFVNVCHEGSLPQKNCRTCANSTAKLNGDWMCSIDRDEINHDAHVGCDGHLFSPPLVPAFAVKGGDGFVKYRTPEGACFVNCNDVGFPASELGDEEIEIYPSEELQHMNAASLSSPEVAAARRVFSGAKVVG